jgi:hypothetical protein
MAKSPKNKVLSFESVHGFTKAQEDHDFCTVYMDHAGRHAIQVERHIGAHLADGVG